ncbi:MAG: hypothetical protein NTZ05_19545 [Chloroflexi bacterium]|nr:hypothetical protein [Chloroflexota bacterium]
MPEPARYGDCLIAHHIERTQEEMPEHPGIADYLLVRFAIQRDSAENFAVEYRIPVEAAGSLALPENAAFETLEDVALRKGLVAVHYVIDTNAAEPGELLEIVWLK